MSLDKVEVPVSLKKQAYEAIKNAIITHTFLPGEALYERNLSESLGISRTPIRESIPLLELNGWVTSIPRKGTFVCEISKQDVEEVVQLRRALEVLVIELLVPVITDTDIERIEQLYGRQCEQLDARDFLSTDRQFHIYLAELSGNRELVRTLQNISDKIRWFGLSGLNTPNRKDRALQEHLEIIEALKTRDIEATKKAVLNHIENNYKAVLSSLDLKNKSEVMD
ncbi:GntR family transcriptional regulator [Ammoniphilus sp. YIM 78166]|uniref:GntR family transcriptional regulator n=1 Tax=Ammoniphilus sp. YIM 78166 TaxID=1644106 RepID=UPI00106F6A63|nr:GntR family transcriptional regulator [Ammoniphilus sp. YIM 78166]